MKAINFTFCGFKATFKLVKSQGGLTDFTESNPIPITMSIGHNGTHEHLNQILLHELLELGMHLHGHYYESKNGNNTASHFMIEHNQMTNLVAEVSHAQLTILEGIKHAA